MPKPAVASIGNPSNGMDSMATLTRILVLAGMAAVAPLGLFAQAPGGDMPPPAVTVVTLKAQDVTLTASAEVFRAILEGEMNPTTAFMTGKLKVDGSMPMAMQLGAALS